jgi:hypothetical protein
LDFGGWVCNKPFEKISFFPSSPAFPKMDVKAPPLSDKIQKTQTLELNNS